MIPSFSVPGLGLDTDRRAAARLPQSPAPRGLSLSSFTCRALLEGARTVWGRPDHTWAAPAYPHTGHRCAVPPGTSRRSAMIRTWPTPWPGGRPCPPARREHRSCPERFDPVRPMLCCFQHHTPHPTLTSPAAVAAATYTTLTGWSVQVSQAALVTAWVRTPATFLTACSAPEFHLHLLQQEERVQAEITTPAMVLRPWLSAWQVHPGETHALHRPRRHPCPRAQGEPAPPGHPHAPVPRTPST